MRFKAEVNFDGREVARAHVKRLDLDSVLKVNPHTVRSQLLTFEPSALVQEMQSFTTSADVERFLLLHGEHIVDVLGSEVDRIESKIKVRFFPKTLLSKISISPVFFLFFPQKHAPEVRHLDLEIL